MLCVLLSFTVTPVAAQTIVASPTRSLAATSATVNKSQGATANSAQDAHAETVLVLGDSISAGYGMQREQGWVNLLTQRLAIAPRQTAVRRNTDRQNAQHRYTVVNASISGDTTGGGLSRLPDLLQRHHPKLVIIELGGNDGLRGYPAPKIRANIEAMVRLCRNADARVVLIAMEIPPNYGARYIDAFRAVFRDVAAQQDVPLAPFLLGGVALDRSLMQADGVHPTAAAQPRLLDTAWPVIQAELLRGSPSQRAAAVPTIDHENGAVHVGGRLRRQ